MNPSTSSNAEAARSTSTFKVSTRQLSADLTTVGEEINSRELGQLSAAQLHDALAKLVLITPDKMLDADPRLVIAGRRGRFLARPKRGKILLFDATDATRDPLEIGADAVADYLDGSELKVGTTVGDEAAAVIVDERKSRTGLIVAMLALSLAVLGTSAYLTFKAPTFDPDSEYKAPAPEQVGMMRQQFSGVFTTGQGDTLRELTIRPEGTLILVEHGPNDTIADRREDTYTLALHGGKTPTARATHLGPIELRADKTLFFAGETYTRQP
jgi:hypothetical protein